MRKGFLLTGLLILAALPIAAQQPPPFFHKPPTPARASGPSSTMQASKSSISALELAPVEVPLPFSGDPNETSLQLQDFFWRARTLIAKGAWKQAQAVLEKATSQFPDSRSLHTLFAELLWYRSQGSDRALLEQSTHEAIRAMEIGLSFGVVDYPLTGRLADLLGRTGHQRPLDHIFAEALARDPSAVVYRQYAQGLALQADGRAEEMFKKAIALEAQGDALAVYGEWLLDQKRPADAMDMLPKTPSLYYLSFLRGVALERMKRPEEAKLAYARFRDYSTWFPAPSRFRIEGSELQAASGIRFADGNAAQIHLDPSSGLTSTAAASTDAQATNGLSYLIYGEARGESYGGMLAVGWEVRARTLRGSVGSPTCPYVTNGGATLADKYTSVICQGNGSQFNGVCLAWCSNPATTSCSHTTSTDNAAYNVYYGYQPDPISGHCPSGISVSGASYCDGSITCNGNTVTYKLTSPLFNLGTTSACSAHSCAPTNYGKVCGNGGSDNCFYSSPNCSGVGRLGYTGTLSGAGANSYSSPYQATSSGNHNGHLEGPETQDFDLYLQTSSSSAGPWQDAASSTLLSAVEEINYAGSPGWYRWRAYSYSGSGSFSLCTKTP